MSPVPPGLEFLVGRFAGTDLIHASDWADEETAKVTAAGVIEIDKGLVVQRLRETRMSGSFEVVNVFMRDPASNEVLLYSFDSLGYPPDPPARGSWQGDELVLHRASPRGMSRTTFAATPHGFRWSKQFRRSLDEEWQPVVNGELARDDDAGRADDMAY